MQDIVADLASIVKETGAGGELQPLPSTYQGPSRELAEWYERGAPIDVRLEWFPEELVLYDPRHLEERQIGYAHDDDALPIPGWLPQWLVIGDLRADPIIAITDEQGTPIAIAPHGAGRWELTRLAPSLSLYLRALTTLLRVTRIEHPPRCFDEETGQYLPSISAQLSTELRFLPSEMIAPWQQHGWLE